MAMIEVTTEHKPNSTRILSEHNNNIEILMDKITYHDGVEYSRKQYRLSPIIIGITDDDGVWFDSDISGEDAQTQAIASAVWTPAVKSATHLSGALKALQAAQGSVDATSQVVVAIEARIAALEAGADAELPPAETAKAAAISKRDTVQGNIDLITTP